MFSGRVLNATRRSCAGAHCGELRAGQDPDNEGARHGADCRQVPVILAFVLILSPVEPSSPETAAERITLPSVLKKRQQVVPMGLQ